MPKRYNRKLRKSFQDSVRAKIKRYCQAIVKGNKIPELPHPRTYKTDPWKYN